MNELKASKPYVTTGKYVQRMAMQLKNLARLTEADRLAIHEHAGQIRHQQSSKAPLQSVLPAVRPPFQRLEPADRNATAFQINAGLSVMRPSASRSSSCCARSTSLMVYTQTLSPFRWA
jgi:hypothetical protein